jgi:hypothetical protein
VSRPVQVLALVSAAALAVFASRIAGLYNGVVQRIAVTLALGAEILIAGRMLTLPVTGSAAGPGVTPGRGAPGGGRRVRGGAGCAAGLGSATTSRSRCCCGSSFAGPGWLTWPRWAGRFLGRALVGAEARGQSPLCWSAAGPGL